uniref:Uncharacterized protein n=1 Tax=viral metagenome TaxID=1070528 RepID=A0A6H1ZWK5_9ZZZZ
MWGIQFDKATSNDLICACARFEVRKQGVEHYTVRWHPDIGMEIDRFGAKGWETIRYNAQPADLEAILPKKCDFGRNWTYSDFMLAMTFFGEGYQIGFYQGEWHERDRQRRQGEQNRRAVENG